MSIWVYHLKNAKKLGATTVTIEKNRKSHNVVWCEGNESVSTLNHPGKHYQYTGNDFESSESYKFYITMLSRQKLFDTIFGVDVPI